MLFSVKPVHSILLYVLEQPRVDNPSAGLLKRGSQLRAIGPIGLSPALGMTLPIFHFQSTNPAACLYI